jgi:hypothetical protein
MGNKQGKTLRLVYLKGMASQDIQGKICEGSIRQQTRLAKVEKIIGENAGSGFQPCIIFGKTMQNFMINGLNFSRIVFNDRYFLIAA